MQVTVTLNSADHLMSGGEVWFVVYGPIPGEEIYPQLTFADQTQAQLVRAAFDNAVILQVSIDHLEQRIPVVIALRDAILDHLGLAEELIEPKLGDGPGGLR